MKTKRAELIFFLSWLAVVLGCVAVMTKYSSASGAKGKAQSEWPEGSSLVRDNGTPSLIVFAHPHCPCTAATIGELERLLIPLKGKVDVQVVFVRPKGESEAWLQSAAWNHVKSLPGVRTVVDVDGEEATRFGARTSGQTYLYDDSGTLVFNGGITPSRGHMGDSLGRAAILDWLQEGKIASASTSVFGCALMGSAMPVAMRANGATP